MSTSLRERPARLAAENGGVAARRALLRWAWRLFRREWRQQLLVLALLALAVAATTVGLGAAANASSLASTFGTADHLLTLSGTDPNLAADLGALRTAFGTIEVVDHQKIIVPGSATGIDLRAQSPNGIYSHPMLRLDTGRYPTGSNEIAVTAAVAKIFNLHVGGAWRQDGKTRQVVGLVENPRNLLDRFALVAPGQASPPDDVTVLVQATAEQFAAATLPDGLQVEIRPSSEQTGGTVAVLILAVIGLLFVGLLAVAGFTVMAQRRLRALGMLGAIGGRDRHIRLVLLANGAVVGAVAAVVGTTVGLAGWFAFSPRLETIAEHRIDRLHLPWWAILAAMLLAVATAVGAAWWPARSAARIPIVAALSARPVQPRPAHRFAAAGAVLLLTGLVLIVESHQNRPPLIVTGIVATTLGMLLLAPVGIAALAPLARLCPIELRLALRDLARYQARSSAALAAVGLAVGISAAIAIGAAADQAAAAVPPTGGTLPTNQLIVWLSPGAVDGPVPQLTATQLQNAQTRVNAVATSLHAQSVLALDAAQDSSAPSMPGGPGDSTAGKPVVELGKPHSVVVNGRHGTEFRSSESIRMFVATPAFLAQYAIARGEIDPTTDILTSRSSIAGYELIGAGRPRDWRPKVQTVALPAYTSDPTTLITSHALQSLGLISVPVGWLIQAPQPLTATQIDKAQQVAIAAGLSIETRPTQASLSQLRTDATVAGIAVALGVLAMTVGLIRSETARDLRTLTATGASSTSRRTLTGATAGALALLGALIGTAGAYLALIAWYHHNLHWLGHVPVANLAGILVGLPVTAAVAGWLLAGREPPAITRQPLD